MEVKRIIEELHEKDPKISKTKWLTYIVTNCPDCINCPLRTIHGCSEKSKKALFNRVLKNSDVQLMTSVVKEYIK